MARPTNEKKGRLVQLRISEELYEKLAKQGENLSETIREILKSDFVVQENREKDVFCKTEPQKPDIYDCLPAFGDIPDEIVKDIKSMIHLWGMSESKFFSELDEALNDGRVDVEGGKVVGHDGLDLTRFYEKCRDMNAKPQDVIDKIVRSMG